MALDQEEIERTLQNDNDNEEGNIANSLSDLLDTLSDEEMYRMFSELSSEQIKHITAISVTGDSMDEQFIRDFMTLQISKKRRGRKELSDVADSFAKIFETEQESRGLRDRIPGL